MMRKQVLLSWSGGKDSALALQALRADPTVEVVGLLTSVTREYERISVHGVRRALLERQAERLRLPLYTIELDPVSTNDAYENAFLSTLERVGPEGTGDTDRPCGIRAGRPTGWQAGGTAYSTTCR